MSNAFRKHKTTFLAIICFFVMSSTGWATTYYISPTGSDSSGNGSQASPWKTLSYACGRVTTAGDTIYINTGNYTDNNTCKLAIGVNIQGAGQSLVTITSAYNGAYGTGFIYRDTSSSSPCINGNNVISGFTLDGSSKTLSTGIRLMGSNNITIHDMTFLHIKTTAIALSGVGGWSSYDQSRITPPSSYANKCIVHDVNINDCTSDTTVTTDDRLGAIDINSMSNGSIYNVIINENYPSHGTGIKASNGWLSNFKVYNSTISTDHSNTNCFVFETYNFLQDSEIYGNNFNHLMSLSGGQTADPSLTGNTWNLKLHDNNFDLSGITPTAGNEFVHNWLNIYNNYFYNGSSPAAGIWPNGGLTTSGVTHWRFNNNVVYNCAAGVYIANGTNSYIDIFNNTFDTMNGGYYSMGYGIWQGGGTFSNTNIQNNLVINPSSGSIYGFSGATTNHNWLNAPNPGITRSGNRPNPYYVPSSTSSNLAGAGINVGLSYTGTAPAIGAYEPGATGALGPGLGVLSPPTNGVLSPPTNLTVVN